MSVLKNSFAMLMRSSSVGYFRTSNTIGLLRQQGSFDQMQPAICTQISEMQKRYKFTHEITETIRYLTKNPGVRPRVDPKTLKLDTPIERPLCVMLCWLGSTPKNVAKYADIYLDQGYDLLTVVVPMMDCLFPENGALKTSSNLLKFMEANDRFNPYMLHSFSIGAFIWAELLHLVQLDLDRYLPVVNRFNIQVWDSMVDAAQFQIGVSRGLFPNSAILQYLCLNYIKFHQKMFYEISTKYYNRAAVEIRSNTCKSPALILCSEADLVGTAKVNRVNADCWRKLGTDVTLKCWEKSAHVQHYAVYPDEYLTTLGDFLEKNNLLLNKPAMQHRIAMIHHKKNLQK